MKVLFLTPQLPYPQISGGVIKSFKLVEYLSSLHELTLGCFLKSVEDENNLPELKQLMPQPCVFAQALHIPRSPINLVRSYLAGVPLTIYRNQSTDFRQKITALADDYDVIFVDHYLMFQYVPVSYRGRVVVHQHNAEFVMWSGFAKQIVNPLKKMLLNFEARRIQNYEVAMCSRANVVLAAPNDSEALIKAGAQACHFIDTYHLGDEANLYLPYIQYNNTIKSVLFIGTLSWEANADGLLWFLSEIWPLIKKREQSVTFTIAGTCTDTLKEKLLQLEPEVQVLGFVDNLEALYQTHRVFIAPLRFGSGIKVKIVNSLCRGVPTVTTEEGAAGLNVKNGEHLFIARSADEFANRVLCLLEDKSMWLRFSLASRQVMQENYTWDVVLNNVSEALHSDI